MPNVAPSATIKASGGPVPVGSPIGSGPSLSVILPNGDIAVTWNAGDVFLQIFAPDRTARTGAITVNTATATVRTGETSRVHVRMAGS